MDALHESIIRPSSEIVTTCHGMNLGMLPISNVAIPNVQFQLELATLATGNISTLATFSVELGASDNRNLAAHEFAVVRGVYGVISAMQQEDIYLRAHRPQTSLHSAERNGTMKALMVNGSARHNGNTARGCYA